MLSHGVRSRFDSYTDNDNNNLCCNRAAGGWQHWPEGNVNEASFDESEQQRIRQLVTSPLLTTDPKKLDHFTAIKLSSYFR